MDTITHYSTHAGSREDKFYKDTLFQGSHMLVGINCLEPGQVQSIHEHAAADKVYIVMEGQGLFSLGDVKHEAGQGEIIWAAAGVPHGVENKHTTRLVLLVGISPPPA